MTKVFISWSGNSEIPDMLKKSLVETFTENNLTVFVSTKNIRTGDEWFKVIKDAITESSITIVCITKDNIQSPWIYFESGAASFHNYLLNQTKPLMVVLFDAELPRNSPLNEYNHIKWGKEGYEKLLVDINSHMDAGKLQSNQISTMAKGSFPGLSRKIKRALKKSGSYDVNVAKQIEVYPDVVKEVGDTGTVLLSQTKGRTLRKRVSVDGKFQTGVSSFTSLFPTRSTQALSKTG